MAFFDEFTAALKKKWLQYYELNYDWLALQMQLESTETPDGGRRPPSYLILGVLNALEPKLAQLMLPFTKLNSDADALIDVLGLNVDPEIALGRKPPDAKKAAPAALAPTETPSVEEAFEAPTEAAVGGFGASLDDLDTDVTEVSSDEDTAEFAGMAMAAIDAEESEEEEFGAFGASLDDLDTDVAQGVEVEAETEAFDEMSLDDMDAEAVEESGNEALMDMSDLAFDEEESLEEASEAPLADIEEFTADVWVEETVVEVTTEVSSAELGDLALDSWSDESSEESTEELLTELGDFDVFGEESSESEEADAFGDMTFEEFGDLNVEEADEWK